MAPKELKRAMPTAAPCPCRKVFGLQAHYDCIDTYMHGYNCITTYMDIPGSELTSALQHIWIFLARNLLLHDILLSSSEHNPGRWPGEGRGSYRYLCFWDRVPLE
jgi:hypothetical protein